MPPLRTLLLWLAPARWRDAIEGDLEESARRRDSRFLRGFWILGHLAVIVVRLRLESIARRLPASVPPGLRGWPGHAWQDACYGVLALVDSNPTQELRVGQLLPGARGHACARRPVQPR